MRFLKPPGRVDWTPACLLAEALTEEGCFSPQSKSGFPLNACEGLLRILKEMKICIQDGATRKFLRGIDTWVDGSSGARNFENSMDAFRHCIDNGLAAVNIIVDYGTSRVPLIIPVDARSDHGLRPALPMVVGK